MKLHPNSKWSQKRFFNSIVVLLDEKLTVDFKSLEMFPVTDGSGNSNDGI